MSSEPAPPRRSASIRTISRWFISNASFIFSILFFNRESATFTSPGIQRPFSFAVSFSFSLVFYRRFDHVVGSLSFWIQFLCFWHVQYCYCYYVHLWSLVKRFMECMKQFWFEFKILILISNLIIICCCAHYNRWR